MVTKYISVSSSKGGSGKSTITSILSTGLLSHLKRRIAVVDIDPQESLIDARKAELKEIENNPPKSNSLIYQTILKNKENTNQSFPDFFKMSLYDDFAIIKQKLDSLNGKYDFVFLDFPGSLNIHSNTILLLKELDYIFIPFYVDKNSRSATFKFAHSLKELKGKGMLKADFHLFFNQFNGYTGKNGSSFKVMRDFMESKKYPLLKNAIYSSPEIERYSTIVPIKVGAGIKNPYHLLEEIYNILNLNQNE
jgi:cellulose biosynthesis protein BcsQ